MHSTSIDNCQNFAAKYVCEPFLKIAEVGGAGPGGSYRPSVNFPQPYTYMIFDLDQTEHVDVKLHHPEDWQLPEEHKRAYDVILSGQTLEHVRRPWVWIRQLVELAKPGALVFITAPHTWEFHEYPIDCWRIWPDGMRALFEDAGIEELECFFKHMDTVGIGRVR